MAKGNKNDNTGKRRKPGSTTSVGKRRTRSRPPGQQKSGSSPKRRNPAKSPSSSATSDNNSTMSNPRSSEYGSQASPLRVPSHPKDLIKVTVVGAAGGIGQPLAMLLMMHSEYVHHLALFDLVDFLPGVGLDVSHMDRQVMVTTHMGQENLAAAVKGASVIIVLAGLAQKPGMSRDDLFGSNAKIMYNIAKCCAQTAPEAMLCVVTNPVNSLVPLTCEVYARLVATNKGSHQDQHGRPVSPGAPSTPQPASSTKSEATTANQMEQAPDAAKAIQSVGGARQANGVFEDCFRRIFGVTTLDVVRANTLTAKSALFKNEPNGLFKDPGKIQVPVVGGHAGKTIMPLLSQATPKLDKKRLQDDKATTLTLIDSIQQAGIDVLNAKRGKGSATLAMAYAACRFTISLLRAKAGEQNIVECCYVRHASPCCNDLEYFAAPMLLGKDGYIKMMADYLSCGAAGGPTTTSGGASGSLLSVGNSASAPSSTSEATAANKPVAAAPAVTSKLLPFEQHMLEEGCRELRLSIVKGEDFAKEQLSSDK